MKLLFLKTSLLEQRAGFFLLRVQSKPKVFLPCSLFPFPLCWNREPQREVFSKGERREETKGFFLLLSLFEQFLKKRFKKSLLLSWKAPFGSGTERSKGRLLFKKAKPLCWNREQGRLRSQTEGREHPKGRASLQSFGKRS